MESIGNQKDLRRCKMVSCNSQDLTSKKTIPLRNQEVNVKINNSIATIDVMQTYFNNTDSPLEITLKLPIEADHALGKLTAQIGDTIIEGKILLKEKAQEKYEDAVAGGHTAFMAEEKESEKDIITLKLGNLLSNQEVIVRFQFLNVLKLEVGAYCIRVPLSFFPYYSEEAFNFQYTFLVDIKSDTNISYVSCPLRSRIIKKLSGGNLLNVQIEKVDENGRDLLQDLIVYYRTNGMEHPILLAQRSSAHPDETACMISFLPSFMEKPISSEFETAEDEKPESIEIEALKERSMYIFMVDRSGSMSGESMEITKEALILFLKSLPQESYFDVVSFGSDFEILSQQMLGNKKHLSGLEYNDQNVLKAIETIKTFSADFGGTYMHPPLTTAAIEINEPEGFTKKIFLLTDGEDESPEQVKQLAKICTFQNICKIHTFGIGSSCSVDLVQTVALNGRGTCSLVPENKNLRKTVIQALAISQEPQYSNCKMSFSETPKIESNLLNQNLNNGFELFRNELFIWFGILKTAQFKKLKVNLQSEKHSQSGRQLKYQWTSNNFKEIFDGDQLFKVAARQRMNELMKDYSKKEEVKSLSLEYQILSSYTSFIAVNKNDQKPIEELKQVEIIQQQYYREPLLHNAKRGMALQRNVSGCAQPYDMACESSSECEMGCEEMSANSGNRSQGAAAQNICEQEAEESEEIEARCLVKADSDSCEGQEYGDEEEEEEKVMMESIKKKSERKSSQTMEKKEMSSSSYPKISSTENAKKIIQASQLSLDDLLMGQSSSFGYWNDQKLILSFLSSINDANSTIQDEVNKLLKDYSQTETVWLTILALYVLNKKFKEKEDEWQLIAKKAKNYLKQQGIDKPEIFIKKIKIPFY